MQILPEILIELQELPDSERGEQEGNRKSGRIHRQQQNSARDRVARRSKRQHRGENWPDARSPPKRERETEQESAPDSRLFPAAAQVNIAIQPARHRRTEESDHREREEMNRAKPGEQPATVYERNHAQNREYDSENDANADGQFYENAEQMQPEEQNQRAGNRRERRAMLAQESADGAGRRAERDEDRGESENESERRRKQSRPRRLTLAQLLHADSGKHRNVSGHQRQHARRQKRNQSREKRSS